MAANDRDIGEFLVARGGPFYELQLRLGLLRDDAFRAVPRAALFVALAWGVPLVLAIVEGSAFGSFEQRPFLLDPWAWSRFFVAVGLIVLSERQVEENLRARLRHFVRAPLLAPGSFEAAASAVSKALRRRDSRSAELVCLMLAVMMNLPPLAIVLETEIATWAARVPADGLALTPAGWWAFFFSNPIFGFLVLRWLWRHLVWGFLLRDLAALELRLAVAHPDGHGGLAFIGEYPSAYATFVFALGCVLSASVVEVMLRGGMELATYGSVMAVWLVLVLIVFAVPLAAFRRPLIELKERATLASGAQATRYFRAAERDVLGRNVSAPEDAEPVTSAEIPDPSKIFAAAQKLSTLPFTRASLLPISLAAVLPLVAAGSTQLPVQELLKVAKRLLLF